MKRGSIVGPLVLIAIGLVFLLKNIRPDLPLFDMFMDYWPFLLIGWGSLRLVEIPLHLFPRRQPCRSPAYPAANGRW